MNKQAVARELVKVAKSLVADTAHGNLVVIGGVPFRRDSNDLYIYRAGTAKKDDEGELHTTGGAEMLVRLDASERKALADFLTSREF